MARSSIKTKRGALEPEPGETARKVRRVRDTWNKLQPERRVGDIRLLTEASPDFYNEPVVQPTCQVVDMSGWITCRALNHFRFDAEFIAKELRELAGDALFAEHQGKWDLEVFQHKVIRTIQSYVARPRLPSGWDGAALLALETAANAIRCWWTIRKSARGLARLIEGEKVKPPHWGKLTLNRRHLWHVQLEDGLSFIAPDWFWRTAPLELPWNAEAKRRLKKVATRVFSEHVANLLVDLSESAEVLSREPFVLRRILSGVEPRGSLHESPGIFIKNVTRNMAEAYDRMGIASLGETPYWLPGFSPLPRKVGG